MAFSLHRSCASMYHGDQPLPSECTIVSGCHASKASGYCGWPPSAATRLSLPANLAPLLHCLTRWISEAGGVLDIRRSLSFLVFQSDLRLDGLWDVIRTPRIEISSLVKINGVRLRWSSSMLLLRKAALKRAGCPQAISRRSGAAFDPRIQTTSFVLPSHGCVD